VQSGHNVMPFGVTSSHRAATAERPGGQVKRVIEGSAVCDSLQPAAVCEMVSAWRSSRAAPLLSGRLLFLLPREIVTFQIGAVEMTPGVISVMSLSPV
jgi:hypothetical protein